MNWTTISQVFHQSYRSNSCILMGWMMNIKQRKAEIVILIKWIIMIMFIDEVRNKHKHIMQMYFPHKILSNGKKKVVPRENWRLLRRSGSFPLFLLCRLSCFGLITAQVSACGCHSSSSLRYANYLKCLRLCWMNRPIQCHFAWMGLCQQHQL